MSSWYVYCLATVESPVRTYVGATIDLDRRLSQHNKERSGGAKATGKVPGGWYRVCHVKGFTIKQDALKFEWRWKYLSRKESGDPLTRRQKGLDKTLEYFNNPTLTVQYE
jgi:predicted GIY-YIG superfamily endonuclease